MGCKQTLGREDSACSLPCRAPVRPNLRTVRVRFIDIWILDSTPESYDFVDGVERDCYDVSLSKQSCLEEELPLVS
jgi:hypothetical protein